MDKQEMVNKLAECPDIQSKAKAERVLKYVLETFSAGLIADGHLAMKGFASITVQHRKARTGRNPRTGETLTIPACNVVKFAPSKTLKAELNAS